MEHEQDFVGSVAKIALGIFVGGLLLWAVFELRARYELQEASRQLQQLTHAAELRHQGAARRTREAQYRRSVDVKREAADRRSDVAVIAQARARKEMAWQAFYQPSTQCLQTFSVECGNAHIRARKEFERRWESGEI